MSVCTCHPHSVPIKPAHHSTAAVAVADGLFTTTTTNSRAYRLNATCSGERTEREHTCMLIRLLRWQPRAVACHKCWAVGPGQQAGSSSTRQDRATGWTGCCFDAAPTLQLRAARPHAAGRGMTGCYRTSAARHSHLYSLFASAGPCNKKAALSCMDSDNPEANPCRSADAAALPTMQPATQRHNAWQNTVLNAADTCAPLTPPYAPAARP